MVVNHKIEGYQAFCEFLDEFNPEGQPSVYLYFSGSTLPTGESWCSDCINAKPIVEKALEKADPASHFVYISVGDRPTWKDLNCAFRTDSRTRLMVIPTLIKLNTPQRLEGEQCEKPELLELIFTEDY